MAWIKQTKPSTPNKMATIKKYIGSGVKHAQFDSVTVTLNVDEAMKYAYDGKSGKRIKFLVSARKENGRFGETHSVFVMVDEPGQGTSAVAEPAMEAPADVTETATTEQAPESGNRRKRGSRKN